MRPTVADQLSSDRLLTPALVIDAQAVDANIAATLSALGGDAGRWRPHVKTAKLAWAIERLLAHGVSAFKCATTGELKALAEAGLHAYDGHLGPSRRRSGGRPGTPSEEHLPIHGTARLPALGDLLALVPRHVWPTVNLFDSAILLDAGRSPRVVPVTARGHEAGPA